MEEYIGLPNASKEALWLRELMLGFKISNVLNSVGSFNLFGNYQAALKLAHNPMFHAKSKHIEVKYHHTRSLIEQGKIKLNYVGTKLQKADLLTKLFPRPVLETQRLLGGLV